MEVILQMNCLNPFLDWVSSSEIGLWWVPDNSIDDKSTLVQVLLWGRQTKDDKYMNLRRETALVSTIVYYLQITMPL